MMYTVVSKKPWQVLTTIYIMCHTYKMEYDAKTQFVATNLSEIDIG